MVRLVYFYSRRAIFCLVIVLRVRKWYNRGFVNDAGTVKTREDGLSELINTP